LTPSCGRRPPTVSDGADRLAVIFARRLRAEGMTVPTGSVALFVEALNAVDPLDGDNVYWAARVVLVKRPEDIDAFDRAFASFWLGRTGNSPPAAVAVEERAGVDCPERTADTLTAEPPSAATAVLRYSPVEVLRSKDFGDYTAADFAEAQQLMARLRATASMRRSRRRRPARWRRDHAPDIRATVRRALRTGGEPIRRAWYAPSLQPRRLVLLCDVSGSMDLYSRALLRFMHAAVAGRRRVEAFAMGTRLTRLTRELSSRDPDQALRSAGVAVADWSGGTRLGDSLRAYNDGWGMRGMSRGAVVVILSDGWERGDPTVIADQMARLSRVAYRVVWVNPLKASPGYAPLARGMAAALPYIDELVDGHNLNALEELVEIVSR
jgi:uncharacterized protein with von Willebrand factor type A (vWA) domain